MSEFEEEFELHPEDELLADPLFEEELKQHAENEQQQQHVPKPDKKPPLSKSSSLLMLESEEVDELTLQAIAELEKDAVRAKDRCSSMGVGGWRQRKMCTNKRYLNNTIIGALQTNRRIEKQMTTSTEEANAVEGVKSCNEEMAKLGEEKRVCSRKSKISLHTTILGNLQSNRVIDQKYERAKKTSESSNVVIVRNCEKVQISLLDKSEDENNEQEDNSKGASLKQKRNEDQENEEEWIEKGNDGHDKASKKCNNKHNKASKRTKTDNGESDSPLTENESCSEDELSEDTKCREKPLREVEKIKNKKTKKLGRKRVKTVKKIKRKERKRKKKKKQGKEESDGRFLENSSDYMSSSSEESDSQTVISKTKRKRKLSKSSSHSHSNPKHEHRKSKHVSRTKKRRHSTDGEDGDRLGDSSSGGSVKPKRRLRSKEDITTSNDEQQGSISDDHTCKKSKQKLSTDVKDDT